jgi:hypothetical protein
MTSSTINTIMLVGALADNRLFSNNSRMQTTVTLMTTKITIMWMTKAAQIPGELSMLLMITTITATMTKAMEMMACTADTTINIIIMRLKIINITRLLELSIIEVVEAMTCGNNEGKTVSLGNLAQGLAAVSYHYIWLRAASLSKTSGAYVAHGLVQVLPECFLSMGLLTFSSFAASFAIISCRSVTSHG